MSDEKVAKFTGVQYNRWAKAIRSALYEAQCESAIFEKEVSSDKAVTRKDTRELEHIERKTFRILTNAINEAILDRVGWDEKVHKIWAKMEGLYGSLNDRS